MTGRQGIRSYVATAFALLFGGLLAITPMTPAAPSLPELKVPAVNLVAVPFPDPADLSLSDYINTVNSSVAYFEGYAQTTVEGLVHSWNTLFSDFDNTLAEGMGSWNDAFTNLGTDMSYWTTAVMDPTVTDLLVTMDPSMGAISLCNVLTFTVEGLQAQFNNLQDMLNTMAGDLSSAASMW